ncbi:MAG: hypothetical protein HXY46_12105 [Syntrophaceae bacterium]|nr:hypothetical protein [Syntrophaceae bacterium]
MKKSIVALIKIGLLAAYLTLTSFPSFAIDPTKVSPVDPKTLREPIPKPTTNLGVDNIYASFCKCDLSDLDAFYMNQIIVYVSNHPPSGGSGIRSAKGVLKVTYHDLIKGRVETVIRDVEVPLGVSLPFGVVTGPVLVKKSLGVKAEVEISGFAVDSYPANNVKTVRECVREFR